jgi:hypothetical protein
MPWGAAEGVAILLSTPYPAAHLVFTHVLTESRTKALDIVLFLDLGGAPWIWLSTLEEPVGSI